MLIYLMKTWLFCMFIQTIDFLMKENVYLMSAIKSQIYNVLSFQEKLCYFMY